MTLNVFAIYDTKSLTYGTPFFMQTVGVAVRAFTDLAEDKQSSINKHPKDYMLFMIGTYDDQKGTFFSISPQRNLGLASDYCTIKGLPERDMSTVTEEDLKRLRELNASEKHILGDAPAVTPTVVK